MVLYDRSRFRPQLKKSVSNNIARSGHINHPNFFAISNTPQKYPEAPSKFVPPTSAYKINLLRSSFLAISTNFFST